jgi:hypothetical protein
MEKPKLPHYEKPDYALTINEAKKDYSRIWNEMSIIVPNLSDEEKRRVIEIVSNTCKYCYKEESGCQCWNDD